MDMKGVLKLGSVSGIKIEVHWTFTLLLLWVVFLDVRRGGNLQTALFNLAIILVLFLCVLLHELGHAMTAKRYHIDTKKITLLPIGGVASLDKMPEKPRQELFVALAGPAVNVVIAILLYLLVPVQSYFSMDMETLEQFLYTPSLKTFLFYLFIANVMLVVFNLIPAFPMDGGRVLRALLTFKMGRVKATAIAASLGQGLAVFFLILGLLLNPFLILIAFFIFFGAYGENIMVKQESLLKGHKVKEAMLTNITMLHPADNMQEVIEVILAGSEKDFVIVNDEEHIVGILYYKDIIKHAHKSSLLVKEVMQTTFKTIDISSEIQEVIDLISKEKKNFFPVIKKRKLVGAIDMSNISEFILLKSNVASNGPSHV